MLGRYHQELSSIGSKEEKVSWQDSSHEIPDQKADPNLGGVSYIPDKETIYDLKILLGIFKDEYERVFAAEEEKYAAGMASYDMLEFLFKPGTKVYGRMGDKLAGFIIDSSTRDSIDIPPPPGPGFSKGSRRDFWTGHCWALTYSGRRIVRTSQLFEIDRFIGDREILSFPLFPTQYIDSSDACKHKSRLQNIGEKYYRILRASPAHMRHSGACWDMERTQDEFYGRRVDTEYTGEIVIDQARASRQKPNRHRRRRSSSPPIRQRGIAVRDGDLLDGEYSDDAVDAEDDKYDDRNPILLDTKAPWQSFHGIDPKLHDHLTPDHYFLLPQRMTGFALSNKMKMAFAVENIHPLEWPSKERDSMSMLILKDSDKDMIKALARKYAKGEKPWGADYIKGKGEGQIFLLHGPPGTGKTYTVECVAEYTRRPLLRLTVADIGTDEIAMEETLGDWFQRATDWGAIILIDEADVFLEKRQVKDLKRNSLVSVFLSCTEYYSGMLFLTTNRIGQIDDAFISRMSIALTYETLDALKQKLIWQGFLKKLSDERKDIRLDYGAKKYLESLDEDESTKDLSWNGREIRNALQTALALATFDAEKDEAATGVKPSIIMVRDEHFQAVVNRRKDFVTYRRSIRNEDEEARAYNEGSRGPPPKKS